MATNETDVVVVGSGVAGLSAAGVLARGGASVVRCEQGTHGGLIINVDELLDAGAERERVSGLRFTNRMLLDNVRSGVRPDDTEVIGIERHGTSVGVITHDATYEARACIIASGASLQDLEVPGESELRGRGVSQCAYCDGPMVRDRVAVVVGAGDSGLQAAARLAKDCSQIHVVHRDDEPTGRWPDGAGPDGVELIPRAEPVEICGDGIVQRVRVRTLTNDHITTIECAAVFVYAGLDPNTGFLPDEMQRDPAGCLITGERQESAIKNVFVAGAVRAGCGGTVADACADGERAGQAVLDRLQESRPMATSTQDPGGL